MCLRKALAPYKLIVLIYNLSESYLHTGHLNHEIKPRIIPVT